MEACMLRCGINWRRIDWWKNCQYCQDRSATAMPCGSKIRATMYYKKHAQLIVHSCKTKCLLVVHTQTCSAFIRVLFIQYLPSARIFYLPIILFSFLWNHICPLGVGFLMKLLPYFTHTRTHSHTHAHMYEPIVLNELRCACNCHYNRQNTDSWWVEEDYKILIALIFTDVPVPFGSAHFLLQIEISPTNSNAHLCLWPMCTHALKARNMFINSNSRASCPTVLVVCLSASVFLFLHANTAA